MTNDKINDVDWSKIDNVPADLADGDDNTQLSDGDIAGFGYIKDADDADADPANEIQSIILSGSDLTLSNGGGTVTLPSGSDDQNATEVPVSPTGDLTSNNVQLALEELQGEIVAAASAAIPDGAVTEPKIANGAVTNDKISDVDWSKIDNVPADLADGDDNTQLTESEVDAFVSNNGFITSANDADADPDNETIQQFTIDGPNLLIREAGTNYTVPIASLGDGTGTDDQALSTNTNPGNVQLEDGGSININVDDADSDPSNEIQELDIDGNQLFLSNGGGTVILPSGSDDQNASEVNLSSSIPNMSAGNVQAALSELQGDIDGLGTVAAFDVGVVSGNIPQLDGDGQLPAVGGGLLTGINSSQIGGLGTAAAFDVGVENQDIVQLDSDGRLPAVDGSQLTNLPSGDWNTLSNIPADLADGDNQTLTFNNATNQLSITDGNTVDLSGLASGGSSPWASIGSDIRFTGGNVGIGTSPGQNTLNVFKEEVNEIAMVDVYNENVAPAFMTFASDSRANEYAIGVDGDANTFRISNNQILGSNDRMTINSSGQFVFGGGNPINSSTGYTFRYNTASFGGIYMNSSGTTSRPYYGYVTGTTVRAFHYVDGASGDWRLSVGTDRLTVENSGEVGIGTIDPSARLDVVGDVEVNGDLEINGPVITPPTSNSSTSTTLSTPTRRIVRITTGSNRTIANIGAGADGQEVILINANDFDVTLQRESNLGGNIRLNGGGNKVLQNTGGTIHLIYDATIGSWLELGSSNNAVAVIIF